MSLPIIQSLWIGAELSNLEKLCVQSFLDHGHEFHLYTYADVAGVPAGAVRKDANDILPAAHIFMHKKDTYAPFSDWFRYALLVKHGGWWVDMDTVCIRPFAFDDEIVLASFADGVYGISPLRFPAGHPAMREMLELCRTHKAPHKAPYGSVGGPVPMTKMILRRNLRGHGKPFFYFHPLEFYSLFNADFAGGIALYPQTHAVHFNNADLGWMHFDKNAKYDDGSLFEQLKARHNIATAADAKRVTGAEFAAMVTGKILIKYERRFVRKRNIRAALAALLLLLIFLTWL